MCPILLAELANKKFWQLLIVLLFQYPISSALAQNFDLDPYFGQFDLESGFVDDPHIVSIAAGGSLDASDLSSDCVGFISEAPDVSINYDSSSFSLNFAH